MGRLVDFVEVVICLEEYGLLGPDEWPCRLEIEIGFIASIRNVGDRTGGPVNQFFDRICAVGDFTEKPISMTLSLVPWTSPTTYG